jgi:hypothetical protein
MYVIMLVLFVLCFGSFAWAMYGGFFLVSSRMSDWAIILRLVSGVRAVCHVVALLTLDHEVSEWLMAASFLYLISLILFWSALATNKRIPLFHCFVSSFLITLSRQVRISISVILSIRLIRVPGWRVSLRLSSSGFGALYSPCASSIGRQLLVRRLNFSIAPFRLPTRRICYRQVLCGL